MAGGAFLAHVWVLPSIKLECLMHAFPILKLVVVLSFFENNLFHQLLIELLALVWVWLVERLGELGEQRWHPAGGYML